MRHVAAAAGQLLITRYGICPALVAPRTPISSNNARFPREIRASSSPDKKLPLPRPSWSPPNPRVSPCHHPPRPRPLTLHGDMLPWPPWFTSPIKFSSRPFPCTCELGWPKSADEACEGLGPAGVLLSFKITIGPRATHIATKRPSCLETQRG